METTVVREEEKIWIPQITDEKLGELFERIKPVADFGFFLGLRYIRPVDLRGTAYTWDTRPAKKIRGLKLLCTIKTYHEYDYYGLFKPSIAEVLAQIPEEHLNTVVAFQIIGTPWSKDDLIQENKALNAGYYVATTKLFVRK